LLDTGGKHATTALISADGRDRRIDYSAAP